MKILKYIAVLALGAVAAIAVPSAAHAAPSWYSGSVAPGGVQNWTWNNVPDGVAYEIGLSPMFASASAPCQFEILRSYYFKQASGEREFRFTIKNIGTITCGTQIMLREFTAINGLWTLPTLVPGATTEHYWNNAPIDKAFVPGLVPFGGGTGTTPGTCALEVTRRWDLLHTNETGGIEREFHFVVKNVGTTTCYGAIILGVAATPTSFDGGLYNPGDTGQYVWNNANPIDKVYVVGIKPSHTSLYGNCAFEVTRRWYLQRVNSGNTLEREFWWAVKSVGDMSCGPINLLG
jgi:hypothetical protein